jgi:DNA topoisomerase-1
MGHLYHVEDPKHNRRVYPILHVEWGPIPGRRVKSLVESIRILAAKASRFISACDYDLEGETIGYNILKYACGEKQAVAQRAHFSTLTEEELRRSFSSLEPGVSFGLANAGRTRHVLDFLYGVNLSRALSEVYRASTGRFRLFTVGRVQGPTLSFIVDREVEIRTHVPTPCWEVDGVFERERIRLRARYEESEVRKFKKAQQIKSCESKPATLTELTERTLHGKPPTPFNLSDLQQEAYKVFKYSPRATSALAERLYLKALISYPRTSSQKLPASIGYRNIFTKLQRLPRFREDASRLLQGRLLPHEGHKTDSAHPAIYPTGELPRAKLEPRAEKLFNLIVRRFMATFAPDSKLSRTDLTLEVSGYRFKTFATKILEAGWIHYYRPYVEIWSHTLPKLERGMIFNTARIDVAEKFEAPPPRYNQATLLEKMEREKIGTKSTRAEIIALLSERGYVTKVDMTPTELAFTIVEVMRTFIPKIMSTELTRSLEQSLHRIEEGKKSSEETIDEAGQLLTESLLQFTEKKESVGRSLQEGVQRSWLSERNLGPCPACHDGRLIMLRSKKSGKRFVGCINYSKGCRASAPLPQRGVLKALGSPCKTCSWPMVLVRTRYWWRLCVNPNCPSKGSGQRDLQIMRKAQIN